MPITPAPASASLQEALIRPFPLPFVRETSLEQVTDHLRKQLRIPVVLDQAALKRLDLTPDAKVKLQLEGVRLKTCLQLLLDQVGMTYRIVPEDNLLILTDREGAEDANERIFAELKELHRDVHDLQDTVDDLVRGLPGAEPGPELKKPTIIEEAPEKHGDAPARVRSG